jgi:hypothetical protein
LGGLFFWLSLTGLEPGRSQRRAGSFAYITRFFP